MTEEEILREIDRLCMEELPKEIRTINESYNDGIILEDFTKTTVQGGPYSWPYLKVSVTDGEYEEKDRILKRAVYNVTIEMVLPERRENWILLSRYREAVRAAIMSEGIKKFSYLKRFNWERNIIKISIAL